jgi:hypothetical protein
MHPIGIIYQIDIIIRSAKDFSILDYIHVQETSSENYSRGEAKTKIQLVGGSDDVGDLVVPFGRKFAKKVNAAQP